jgi:uncharacterized protein (TIGR01244 family)
VNVSRSPGIHWLKLGLAILLAAGNLAAARERGLPPSEGIVNFGKVNEHLYRGAQPDAQGIRNLARLGVKTIIDLRMTNDLWQAESAAALTSGITYTNIPMRGFGRPTEAQVATLLALIETTPGPIFIHCHHGCDRTGTIIACYRIRHDKWSNEAALQEAGRYGMSRFERGMRNFVLGFGKSPKQKPAAEAAR